MTRAACRTATAVGFIVIGLLAYEAVNVAGAAWSNRRAKSFTIAG
jgi:hypothetical protein